MNRTSSSASPRRRSRGLLIAGLTAGVALAVAAPLAASAHVHVTPDAASAGATSSLTFSFSHGCDDSPTTALVFDIPTGVGTVTPVVQGGWSITRELGSNGVPTQVTFTSDQPIESGLKASVSMDVLFDEAAANTTVAFPLTQECVTGSTAWTEIPAEGADDESVESPAPAVAVGAVTATDDEGHSDDHSAMTAGSSEAAATAPADPTALWLSGGALVVAIAALAVSLLRGRKRNA